MISRKKCSEEGCDYPVWARGKCRIHDKGKPKSKPKKATGEKIVFEMIYEERPHISFISGLHVDCIAHNFAHVLSKGSYPKFRLRKDNIVFLTPEEHHLYDFGTEEDRVRYVDRMKEDGIDVDWDKLYSLRDKLKLEYQLTV